MKFLWGNLSRTYFRLSVCLSVHPYVRLYAPPPSPCCPTGFPIRILKGILLLAVCSLCNHGCKARVGHGLPKVSLRPAMAYPPMAVSVVARPQGVLPAAIFYPLRHPTPYAYDCNGNGNGNGNDNGHANGNGNMKKSLKNKDI
jgi:hypothetical protein